MTDSITREEFHAHFDAMQAGLTATSKDVRDLANSVNSFIQTSNTTAERVSNLADKVDDAATSQEKFMDDVAPRVRTLEIHREKSKLRWWFLGVVVTAIVSLTAFIATTVVKPLIDTIIQGQKIAKVINRQTEIMTEFESSMTTVKEIMIDNYSKEKAEAIVKSNRGE